ncbi:restriction endonuclease [Mycolicibacterium novocastrense]|nr:restriction endonuclease [Mycolicibacterium novocastrense]
MGDDEGISVDLPAPSEQPVLTTSQLAGPRLKPSQILRVYSPEEWEEFVLEWANALKSQYVKVRRFSGPGDKGRDVVGFATDKGLQGDWDCFQCKHYDHALYPSDAYPEIAKIMIGVADGLFVMPRRYRFLAPKGAGPSLEQLFSDPTQLRSAFAAAVSDENQLKHLTKQERATILAAIDQTNFAIFDSEQMDEVIEVHRNSPYHLSRFGGQLENRPPVSDPPSDIDQAESGYIEKLVKIYRERLCDPAISLRDIIAATWYRNHLSRQRQCFFSAEALRAFARDKVPPQTFDALQQEIYDGVVEVEQSDHPNGLERLTSVLNAACAVDLSENALITVSRMNDRKGICHQLANDDRLDWLAETE